MSTFPIISKFGGRGEIAEALTKAGFPTTRDQVRMWEARGRIPGDSVVEIMRLAERRRIEYCAADFGPRAAQNRLRKAS